MDKRSKTLEQVNPIFNTAKVCVGNLARAMDPDARALCEALQVTPGEGEKALAPEATEAEHLAGTAMIEMRYRTMLAMALDAGAKTIVDLPAGYTPRAIQLARMGRPYVGLDLPAVVDEVVDAVGSVSDALDADVRYAACDATNIDSLRAALTDAEGPLCFCTEGLLMYFNASESAVLCDNVHALLEERGGCWITADPEMQLQLIASIAAIAGPSATGFKRALDRGMMGKADVDLAMDKPLMIRPGHEEADAARVRAFLEQHGFAIEQLSVATYMPPLGCLEGREDLLAAMRDAMGAYHFWKMTLGGGQKKTAHVASEGFSMESSITGDTLRLRLAGRLDTLSSPQVIELFEEISGRQKVSSISIDCSRLGYVSSAGLRVILIMRKRCADLTLFGIGDMVFEILDHAGFTDLMDVERQH